MEGVSQKTPTLSTACCFISNEVCQCNEAKVNKRANVRFDPGTRADMAHVEEW